MYAADFDGIRFIEGRPEGARVLRPIRVEFGRGMDHAQLRNLDDVKRAMAYEARKAGANAIVDFAYGQATPGFWASLLSLDDVHWYGRGSIAVV